jgi:ATP-dependent Clp protease ATP-binding subunit ClpX
MPKLKKGARRADPLTAHTPRGIHDYLDRFVIGQGRSKRAVAIAAYNHLKRIEQPRRDGLLKKSNILLIGPTGCGKTHIARHLAQCLDVPFTVVDATEYTEAGYYGKDVEVMVAELLFQANHVIEEAQRGIVFVDEVDKIARRSHGARTGAGSRDIGGEGVQQALLKLLEGRKVFVPLNVTQHWSKHDFVQVDTTDILFICAGTFSDLHMYNRTASTLGFVGGGQRERRQRITHKDLLEFGMIAEFLGRLPVVVELSELSSGELGRILVEPEDSVIREYKELLGLDGIRVRFKADALEEVVEFACRREVGARGLRAIVEEVLGDIMFEAPERRGSTVTIDKKLVRRRLEQVDRDDLLTR